MAALRSFDTGSLRSAAVQILQIPVPYSYGSDNNVFHLISKGLKCDRQVLTFQARLGLKQHNSLSDETNFNLNCKHKNRVFISTVVILYKSYLNIQTIQRHFNKYITYVAENKVGSPILVRKDSEMSENREHTRLQISSFKNNQIYCQSAKQTQNRLRLRNLKVSQLDKKFPTFYENQMFIILYTRDRHFSLNRASRTFPLRRILIHIILPSAPKYQVVSSLEIPRPKFCVYFSPHLF